ncbi:hypothetical protein HPP92_013895 [Vanilla planifolia]|uniref:Uncharacterized protein n=1 Tax=Vanilla planifolia TaxID=51239 RepID=A0A835UV73_VANPL|nr:hypothetical protein HPP92_013895 [Vanilla planifolia]
MARALIRFAVEAAPPQMIRVTKLKVKPSRVLETIVEEEMDDSKAFSSSSGWRQESCLRPPAQER